MQIPIFDGHNDVLSRLCHDPGAVPAFLTGRGAGHLDMPRARQGQFAGGLFAMFAPSPGSQTADAGAASDGLPAQMPAPPDLTQAQQAVGAMLSLLLRIEREAEGTLRICRTADELDTSIATGVLAAVIHMEGAEAIDTDLEFLDVLHAAGLRSLGRSGAGPTRSATACRFDARRRPTPAPA